jgi:GDP/UDP-N,N'-diacetylbacillosamine 2-epimerase (hydrolysing)
MKRKILYVSGTRADYGLMRSVLFAIHGYPGLSLEIGVTGMHLLPEFGSTIQEIRKDGFSCHIIDATSTMDSRVAMALFVGDCLRGCGELFRKVKPDIILILGDRGEMLSAAVAGAYMGIPVVHVHGGDRTSTVDDIARHAITKLSHVHCPATQDSADRIIKMGEDPRRVHVVGSPGIEQILRVPPTGRDELASKYSITWSRRLILVIFHPESFSTGNPSAHMEQVLDAVLSFHEQVILIYPNADAGGRAMIDVIQKYEGTPDFRAYPSIPHRDFLGLLNYASVLVGNSSSGIIEAPSFGTPAVNIGNRQQDRTRGKNVIDTGYTTDEIRNAIDTALNDLTFRESVKKAGNPYGDGMTSGKITKILADLEITPDLLQKRMMY